MRLLKNNKGIALVTSLMFTVLALVISMTLLYMVMIGTRTSGALKRYKTVLEATYGGTELITRDLLNSALSIVPDASLTEFSTSFQSALGTLSDATFNPCLQTRTNLQTKFWTGTCANATADPTKSPDITFSLSAVTGSKYKVYAKIIDTREWVFTSISTTGSGPVLLNKRVAGNSDRSGTSNLQKGGTGSQLYTAATHYPYTYRIEVQGEREQNSNEKANLSVLYAY